MTDLLERGFEAESPASGVDVLVVASVTTPDVETPQARPTLGEVLRPALVALLPTAGAAVMTGGIFGSWSARALGVGFTACGVTWALLAYRSRRRLALQVSLVPLAFVLGAVSLVPTREGPTGVFKLMTDAVSTGRLLRPPVPFDAGWRPIFALIFMVTGFGAGWLALALKRPQLGLLLPVPILLLTAMSQPAEGQLLGSILGFMPVLMGLGLLFGGAQSRDALGRDFEVRRLLRSLPMAAGGLVLLVVLSQTSFLFPEPVYDPTDKPQKPKPIPLSEVVDRVLFEVVGDLTGPWRIGVLDVYDGESWRLPPFDSDRLLGVPKSGVVDRLRRGDVKVAFTIRDLGDSSVLPGVTDPVSIATAQDGLRFDPRTATFRMKTGRAPAAMTYTLALPAYPKPEQLEQAGPARDAPEEFTRVPKPPPPVRALLDQAPVNPWQRLEFLRKRLNQDVVAVGAGNPGKPVPPAKVSDLLFGSKQGSPYEIVAAEALLARWAGWPARVGFGFDGVNLENGKKTVRPRNGSNWLEIKAHGAGWIPIIGAPPKAKASLDSDPNARFDATITPSDDIAAELLIPVKVESLRLLYERVRAALLAAMPFVVAAIAAYLSTPAALRTWRRRKRRRWAHRQGPRAQIVVEYAELRDALFDLNVGDSGDTPLEYLQRCVPDDEHEELAWLVTRATYGDLAFAVDESHVEAAADLAASVRKRMFDAQPMQSRVLAALSRESLRHPYTDEVPTVRTVTVGLRALATLGRR